MNMTERFRDRAQGGGRILLFDVGVKRVEVNPNVRFANSVDEARRVLERVEKIGLEAVERLQAEGDSRAPRMARDAPWHAGMAYALGYMRAAIGLIGAG